MTDIDNAIWLCERDPRAGMHELAAEHATIADLTARITAVETQARAMAANTYQLVAALEALERRVATIERLQVAIHAAAETEDIPGSVATA